MSTTSDICRILDGFAPFADALDYDNVGLLVGSSAANAHKIGVCLDITADAVQYASDNNIDVIVSHHPVIFDGLKRIESDSAVYLLIKNGITAICAHTNLDCAKGGVNDCLCDALKLINVHPFSDLSTPSKPPIGRIGELDLPLDSAAFAGYVKQRLNASGVKFCGNKNEIKRVAVCGGAGSDLIEQVYALGADAYVTSEIKQHEWIAAASLDMTVIDAGHYFTENVVVPKLQQILAQNINDCEVVIIPQSAPYSEL